MRIAVTGHMDICESCVEPIRAAIADRLSKVDETVTGISCLARGADSIFAQEILSRGGSLEVILPSPLYRQNKVKPDHAPIFDALLGRAAVIHTLPHHEVNREAYEEANKVLLGSCDELLAVWDGQPSQRSGTGTVVEAARCANIPVNVVWPVGSSRRS